MPDYEKTFMGEGWPIIGEIDSDYGPATSIAEERANLTRHWKEVEKLKADGNKDPRITRQQMERLHRLNASVYLRDMDALNDMKHPLPEDGVVPKPTRKQINAFSASFLKSRLNNEGFHYRNFKPDSNGDLYWSAPKSHFNSPLQGKVPSSPQPEKGPHYLLFDPKFFPGANEDGSAGALDYTRHRFFHSNQDLSASTGTWEYVFDLPYQVKSARELTALWNKLAEKDPQLGQIPYEAIPDRKEYLDVFYLNPEGHRIFYKAYDPSVEFPDEGFKSSAVTAEMPYNMAHSQSMVRSGWPEDYGENISLDEDIFRRKKRNKERVEAGEEARFREVWKKILGETTEGQTKIYPIRADKLDEIHLFSYKSILAEAISRKRFELLEDADREHLDDLGHFLFAVSAAKDANNTPLFKKNLSGSFEEGWGARPEVRDFIIDVVRHQGRLLDKREYTEASDNSVNAVKFKGSQLERLTKIYDDIDSRMAGFSLEEEEELPSVYSDFGPFSGIASLFNRWFPPEERADEDDLNDFSNLAYKAVKLRAEASQRGQSLPDYRSSKEVPNEFEDFLNFWSNLVVEVKTDNPNVVFRVPMLQFEQGFGNRVSDWETYRHDLESRASTAPKENASTLEMSRSLRNPQLDKNNDGKVDKEELKKGVRETKAPEISKPPKQIDRSPTEKRGVADRANLRLGKLVKDAEGIPIPPTPKVDRSIGGEKTPPLIP